jgi:hypothetical protein
MVLGADVLDRLTALADKAEGYPTWARGLFGITFALALVAVFVFAVLYPRGAARHQAPPVGDTGS